MTRVRPTSAGPRPPSKPSMLKYQTPSRNGLVVWILPVSYVLFPPLLSVYVFNDQPTYTACSTSVTVELSFGGNTWTMSPSDFEFTSISSTECIGAFFEITSTAGSSTPTWIIGDAFLVCIYPPAHGSPVYRSLTHSTPHRKPCTLYSNTTHPQSGSLPFPKLPSPRTASTAPSPPPRSVLSPQKSPARTVLCPESNSDGVWCWGWECSRRRWYCWSYDPRGPGIRVFLLCIA